jgi:tetratricopeptide (TPR) repeat protein
MGVDERNDHSFRIPRPDLSVNSDIPNACNNCHKDKSASWAERAMKKWYRSTPIGKQNFSHDLSNLRKNSKDFGDSLYNILLGTSPQIAKVTAITYLGNIPSKQTFTTTLQLLRSKEPETRLAALKALESFPLKLRVRETFKLLDDSEMPVRIEAARQLSFVDKGKLDRATSLKLQKAIQEYKKTLLFNADRAESQTALATLYTNLKEYDKAEQAYLEALRIQKKFVPAYVNYASFLHKSNRDAKAYEQLQKGLKEVDDSAALYHSLGLYYTRHKESTKAL